MLIYAILGLLFLGGVVIAWQGIQIMNGKRRPRMKMFERSLLQLLSLAEQGQITTALGSLRFIYGLILIGLGIYFLLLG